MIKKILVSQPKPSSDKSPYYDIATDLGVELVFRPFFKVEGLSAKEFRQQKVKPAGLYSSGIHLPSCRRQLHLALPR